MQASQACDPGSNPGGRTILFRQIYGHNSTSCYWRVMIAMTPMSHY
jgi:hypothetical protein